MATQHKSYHTDDVSTKDNGVHTPENPYCDDLSCWCHTNVIYHDQVTSISFIATDAQVEQAYGFFGFGHRR